MKHTREEKKIRGSNSLCNPHEIEQVLDVAKKLMKNKYSPNDVTVLCPYSGQVFTYTLTVSLVLYVYIVYFDFELCDKKARFLQRDHEIFRAIVPTSSHLIR